MLLDQFPQSFVKKILDAVKLEWLNYLKLLIFLVNRKNFFLKGWKRIISFLFEHFRGWTHFSVLFNSLLWKNKKTNSFCNNPSFPHCWRREKEKAAPKLFFRNKTNSFVYWFCFNVRAESIGIETRSKSEDKVEVVTIWVNSKTFTGSRDVYTIKSNMRSDGSEWKNGRKVIFSSEKMAELGRTYIFWHYQHCHPRLPSTTDPIRSPCHVSESKLCHIEWILDWTMNLSLPCRKVKSLHYPVCSRVLRLRSCDNVNENSGGLADSNYLFLPRQHYFISAAVDDF